ncbi:hypothetical protein [Longispora albida]|uniref:hypothetical protein n=1 Tax=Longispora albida TaxID=203523 RepID=UPI0003819366|nr:hypothetical protein [Longispora albida]
MVAGLVAVFVLVTCVASGVPRPGFAEVLPDPVTYVRVRDQLGRMPFAYLLDGHVLYVATRGRVEAKDLRKRGQRLWTVAELDVRDTPDLRVVNGILLVSSTEVVQGPTWSGVTALDARTGAVRWAADGRVGGVTGDTVLLDDFGTAGVGLSTGERLWKSESAGVFQLGADGSPALPLRLFVVRGGMDMDDSGCWNTETLRVHDPVTGKELNSRQLRRELVSTVKGGCWLEGPQRQIVPVGTEMALVAGNKGMVGVDPVTLQDTWRMEISRLYGDSGPWACGEFVCGVRFGSWYTPETFVVRRSDRREVWSGSDQRAVVLPGGHMVAGQYTVPGVVFLDERGAVRGQLPRWKALVNSPRGPVVQWSQERTSWVGRVDVASGKVQPVGDIGVTGNDCQASAEYLVCLDNRNALRAWYLP